MAKKTIANFIEKASRRYERIDLPRELYVPRQDSRASLSAHATAASLLLGLALAGPVQAQDNRACQDDVRRLCADDVPDVEKIAACVCRNIDKVSPGCRAAMKSVDCRHYERRR